MAGQKIEDLLNLALDATQEEREKSLELDVGYDPIEREWDVIVKYTGSLDNVRNVAVRLTDLLNEYAIVTVKESRLSELAALREVEYIEKPKRLFFQTADGRRVSCIDEVQEARFSLFGQGVLVAVIDSGIDYMLPDFRNEDGSTRILALWDQSAAPRQEEGEAPPGRIRGGDRVYPGADQCSHRSAVRSAEKEDHPRHGHVGTWHLRGCHCGGKRRRGEPVPGRGAPQQPAGGEAWGTPDGWLPKDDGADGGD